MEKTKILVVFYSMTGNVAKLAKALSKGAESAGAEVRLRQAAELVPKEKWNDIMKKVKEELNDIPIAANDDLIWADGIAFGTPTRFGNASSQLRQFIDGTGSLWAKGALVGKIATMFTSTSTQHGGQETTILSSIPPLLHHGMIIMGIPPTEKRISQTEKVSGGSYYGASSIGIPNENDLEIAKTQGRRLAEVAGKLRG